MSEKLQLTHPWLVAVWPGMGHVAINAGIYLLSKLEMSVVAEMEAEHFFDVEQVEVRNGLVQPIRRPTSRYFLWRDPLGRRDLVLFVGEAQPPFGKFAFCQQIIAFAKEIGVERLFTFAAMATAMHPEQASRVFGAATETKSLAELKRAEVELLDQAQIGGLNGVLLGVAAEQGLHGVCLLGEIPQIFAQLPFPKASQAILEVFTMMSGTEIDFTEIKQQASAVEQRLGEILSQVTATMQPQPTPPEEEPPAPETEGPPGPSDEELEKIEGLFQEATVDRSKAFLLKQELDRLGLFKTYEDRFLNLFRRAEDQPIE